MRRSTPFTGRTSLTTNRTDTLLRPLLVGGDRRSIAQSNRARTIVELDSSRVPELVELTSDSDWLVSQRALDLLEKLARTHADWVAPYKHVFLGPLADSDKWEIRLQIVRALPLFSWTTHEQRHVERILRENVDHPQTFVRAWALDSLATIAERNTKLKRVVDAKLSEFEGSGSKALAARARKIRARMMGHPEASAEGSSGCR